MAKKTTKTPRNQTVDDIAGEHSVDPETVRRWVRAGCPAEPHGRGKPLRLNSAEVEAWKRENNITGERGRPIEGDSPDLEAARLRKENALAAKYELQVQRERGELVPVEDVKRWINEHVGAARNKFLGFGARITPMLEGRDNGERQQLVDDGVREILNDLVGNELAHP